MYSKSDQNTRAKQVGQNRFFQTARHTPFKKLYVLLTMFFESKQAQKTWFTKRIVFSKWRPIHIGHIMV